MSPMVIKIVAVVILLVAIVVTALLTKTISISVIRNLRIRS